MSFEEDFKDYYFIIEFPTCNSFRQILEFMNQSHKTIPLCLTQDQISIRQHNDCNTIFFDGVINGYNMITYYIDPEYINKDKEYFIHIPILPLLINLKRVQKKQHIKIVQKKGRESFITILGEVSTSMCSEIRIDPSRQEPFSLEIEDPVPVNRPNVTMQLSGFHYSATGCGRISDRISRLRVYSRGLEIFSSSAQGESTIVKGFCEGDIISEVTLSGDIMKAISKLASLCDEGIVRIYSKDESHIRLEIPISVIGTAYIYLLPQAP